MWATVAIFPNSSTRLSSSTECISTNSRTARVVNLSTISWSFLYLTTTFRMIPSRLGKTSWIIAYWYLLVIVISCFINSTISHTLILRSCWNHFGWCINFGTRLTNHVLSQILKIFLFVFIMSEKLPVIEIGLTELLLLFLPSFSLFGVNKSMFS